MQKFAAYSVANDLATAFPELTPGRYRISVITAGSLNTWSFAPITNNDTQLATVVSPE